jgi:hypothetical protein
MDWTGPTSSSSLRLPVRTTLQRTAAANDLAIRRALEAAGVEFIAENGGGPGVRLRKSAKEKP